MGRFLIAFFVAFASAGALAQSQKLVLTLEASAYTSSFRETDATPFITATGMRTRLGVLAVSRDLLKILPFGTKVRLKDLGSIYGRGKGQFDYLFRDRIFVVADVMNARWTKKLDVWLPDRALALKFGRRILQLEVVAYPE
ncbi:hypothetical protein GCM10007092_22010 [Thermus composti]|uniref:3D domain-containing protein n=1 Tax=Thermus composti TaxID=532059 RepID=A0ABV6Q0F0_9DEIN|nr:3D domain-containing protein [Thermus composti]GGN06726.1 hypothetical protein GCM10007092_22010 [Thermus composti]